MQQFFKITNQEETHNEFVYQDGMNILRQAFNGEPDASCVTGGFYFTTIEHIPKFYELGINLRVVELPLSDPEFRCVNDPAGDRWRANKIYLGKKYSLFDPETYKLFGLDITQNKYIVDFASQYGRIDFLEWFKNSGLKLDYSSNSMDWPSYYCRSSVLQWWKESGLESKYSDRSLDWASSKGHINILNWWLKSGLELKYTQNSMDQASNNKNLDVLNWWLKSGLKLRYNYETYTRALYKNETIAQWWRDHLISIND